MYPSLRTPPAVSYRRQRVDTPDGDFVDFDWLANDDEAEDDAPLVVLFHGLEGNSSSPYARALMRHLRGIRWRGVVPLFRGCSGDPNRLPRAYHSGDHAEIAWMMGTIRAQRPRSRIYAVGVSLGGSALLNWLGRQEAHAETIVTAAAAVSTPLDLTAAGIAIGQGLNRIYTYVFLRTLVPKALAMARRFPGLLDERRISRADSMYEFDDAVTAPLHGFDGVGDYWSRASSKPWLRLLTVPTLVLNAQNDPFVPASSLPRQAEVSASVSLEYPRQGGHAGFAVAPFPGNLGWLPARLVEFLGAQRWQATPTAPRAEK